MNLFLSGPPSCVSDFRHGYAIDFSASASLCLSPRAWQDRERKAVFSLAAKTNTLHSLCTWHLLTVRLPTPSSHILLFFLFFFSSFSDVMTQGAGPTTRRPGLVLACVCTFFISLQLLIYFVAFVWVVVRTV